MKLAAVGVMIAVACFTVQAEPGLAFSVKPGMLLNAAHIGYKSDNLFLGGGLEFASVSFSTEQTYEDTTGFVLYTSTAKYDVSVFLPQAAARVYFGSIGDESQEAGYARPFAGASLFYSLAMASISMTYGGTTMHDTVMEKSVKDILGGNLGGTVAFGGEYYIARAFSVGGELGVRYAFGGARTEYEGYENTAITDTKLGLGFTYTTLGLNFYF